MRLVRHTVADDTEVETIDMIGGTVIETIDAGDRVWINCRDDAHKGDNCAINVVRNVDALVVCPGDSVWWQSRNAYWTPQNNAKGIYDIAIPRIGYSGAARPKDYASVPNGPAMPTASDGRPQA